MKNHTHICNLKKKRKIRGKYKIQTWYLWTISVPSSSKVKEYVIGLLVDWIVNLSWTSPIENLCPSTVQIEMPHLSFGTLANWGMYPAG